MNRKDRLDLRKIGLKILLMWLTVGMLIGTARYNFDISAQAKTERRTHVVENIEEKIYDVSQDRINMEKKKERLKRQIKSIEKEKQDVIRFINKSDDVLTELQKQIDDKNYKITRLEGDLQTLDETLADLETRRSEIYNTCIKRITYMYENSDTEYISLLLSSSGLVDLLNNMEYVEQITNFDKNLLDEYDRSVEYVKEKQKEKDEKYADIIYIRDLLKDDREDVRKVIEKKRRKLDAYNSDIEQAEENIEEAAKKIEEAEAQIEELLSAQRAKQVADAAAMGGSSSGVPVSDVNASATGFIWPLRLSGSISSGFGPRVAPTAGASTFHHGVDISVPSGSDILAAKDGKVVISMYSSSAGNYIGIYHGNNVYSYYMHCSALLVKTGQKVMAGEVIGRVGSTGISTGPHLHFALHVNGEYVDPMLYLVKP
jgi:murein DD-endopeptidase MepM/ murein hydrolase activator NlpD